MFKWTLNKINKCLLKCFIFHCSCQHKEHYCNVLLLWCYFSPFRVNVELFWSRAAPVWRARRCRCSISASVLLPEEAPQIQPEHPSQLSGLDTNALGFLQTGRRIPSEYRFPANTLPSCHRRHKTYVIHNTHETLQIILLVPFSVYSTYMHTNCVNGWSFLTTKKKYIDNLDHIKKSAEMKLSESHTAVMQELVLITW